MSGNAPQRSRWTRLDTPIGALAIVAHGDAIVSVRARGQRHAPAWPLGPEAPDDALLLRACAQLRLYFAGERASFELPLAPAGTPFQQAVWQALQTIEAGSTRSYADVARTLGRPSAVRAVASAIGRNPCLVLVPCHRVVGSDGALTGFAAGLPAKRWLLAHEGARGAVLDSNG